MFEFFIVCLVVWRISNLLFVEDGPWKIFVRLRNLILKVSSILNCFYCITVWVSIPFAVYKGIFFWFAYSAGAIIIHELLNYLSDVQLSKKDN